MGYRIDYKIAQEGIEGPKELCWALTCLGIQRP